MVCMYEGGILVSHLVNSILIPIVIIPPMVISRMCFGIHHAAFSGIPAHISIDTGDQEVEE